jgi:nucleotide-binding universal stress UspA family protein
MSDDSYNLDRETPELIAGMKEYAKTLQTDSEYLVDDEEGEEEIEEIEEIAKPKEGAD